MKNAPSSLRDVGAGHAVRGYCRVPFDYVILEKNSSLCRRTCCSVRLALCAEHARQFEQLQGSETC